VLTAIALVMIVVLATLGIRPALLVGFAIPTSFLLCFAMLAIMGITISNIVMFGLILAVGMLVDGAIVVVEYADRRIDEGAGPMTAYVDAAKRMFWPVVSSTATTLCAFLPMLFWPGVAGQFMGMLPVTLIFVLSASLLVALVYLPVMGGVTGRLEQWFDTWISRIAGGFWLWHVLLFPVAAGAAALASGGVPQILEGVMALFAGMDMSAILGSVIPALITGFAMLVGVAVLAGLGLAGVVALLLGIMAAFRRLSNGASWARGKVLPRRAEKVTGGYHRSPFGWVIHSIVANPVMPLVACCTVFVIVGSTLVYYMNNNNGTEFFVESEPEQAIVYVRGRGNLSIEQKDDLVRQVEDVVLAQRGVQTAFAFAGDGGLDNNTGGAQPPLDTIGQVQFETTPWDERPNTREPWLFGLIEREVKDASADGDVIIDELTAKLSQIPGIKVEILGQTGGPGAAKPVHLRLKGDDWELLQEATAKVRARFERTAGLVLIEDTLPLPGIDWQIDVDVQRAGRFGADVATVGAMVQLVTRGIMLDTMRVPSSDEEIEIRVRLPEEDRLLSTLDTLKVRTRDGLIPLSNFITRTPVPKLAEIARIDQKRVMDVKADVTPGLMKMVKTTATDDGPLEQTVATLRPAGADADFTNTDGDRFKLTDRTQLAEGLDLQEEYSAQRMRLVPVNANERIAEISKWVETADLPDGITYEWTGDQEEQAESQAFLSSAFTAALGLMFIILLAQFNSFYNAVLVLVAVVLSTAGVLIGMLVMDQTFSIIMTGTGIVALAGIVVNNNIILIDTYQEFSRYMPRIEAIIRTAQARIRPVLLTTITTMAGLAPMMFGLSLDFANGGYTIDSPTALWWKQLATAVVFGLGIATVLTLVLTPSLLAIRVWASTYAIWIAQLLARMSLGRASRAARDWALLRDAKRTDMGELIWDMDAFAPAPTAQAVKPAE